ncbi:MAG TPA: peptide ABC transporter permease [Armatimonadetes bacterium]|nr:peptide ABC transporter permease [Armatimonadota bacterium]
MHSTRPAGLGRRLLREPQFVVGSLLVAVFVVAAIAAPWLSPLDPSTQFPEGLTSLGQPMPPGTPLADAAAGQTFRLGTDTLGRDLFTRLLYGARFSLVIGLLAMLTAVGVGALVGLLSGFYRSWLEFALMRLTDVMMTVPTLILAIALVAVMPRGSIFFEFAGAERELPRELLNLFVVIGLVSWTGVARVVRSETLRVSALEFVPAARALGCSPHRVLVRHVLPNVLPTIVVLASLGAAGAIVMDAGLSYLGLGVRPPHPTWGKMIADGQAYMTTAPWLVLAPGLSVVAVVLGFNLLGQGLQEALDPHQGPRA